MEALYGVSPDEGISMWVADMEFTAASCIQKSLQEMVDHGVYGYFGDDSKYKACQCIINSNSFFPLTKLEKVVSSLSDL